MVRKAKPPAGASARAAKKTVPPELRSATGWFGLERDRVIWGWALGRDEPGLRQHVTLYIDGEKVGEAMADRWNAKLAQTENADGFHAFAFALPPRYFDGAGHVIDAVVATPGYHPTPLKTKIRSFTFETQHSAPTIDIDHADSVSIAGVLTADGEARSRLDIWIGGRRLSRDDVELAWEGGDGDVRRRFKVISSGRRISEIAFQPMAMSYPGYHELLEPADGAPLARFALESQEDGRVDLRIKGLFEPPPNWSITVKGFAPGSGKTPLFVETIEIENGRAQISGPQGVVLDSLSYALFDADGVQLGGIVDCDPIRLHDALVRNGNFARWVADAPYGFDVPQTLVVERGFYAFPSAMKKEYGLSGNILAAAVPLGERRTILSQTIMGHDRIGSSVELRLGLFARASSAVTVTLQLLEEDGTEVATSVSSVGRLWASDGHVMTVRRRSNAALTLRLLAQAEAEDAFLELAGVSCGPVDIVSMAGAGDVSGQDVDPVDEGNLVQNPDLLIWPSGLSFRSRRKRFEAADGWNIYLPGTPADLEIGALPSPRAGAYALSLKIPPAAAMCRLEVNLTARAMRGRYTLQFSACCNGRTDATGARFAREQWGLIEKVGIFRRGAGGEGEQAATVAIAHVARRIVLSQDWRTETITFDMPAGEEGDAAGEYILSFEFGQPMDFRIHGVDLCQSVATTAFRDPVPLVLEDANILLQLGTIKGLEEWSAGGIVHPAAHSAALPAPTSDLRWSPGVDRGGRVEVAICVHNAPDDVLACLESLIGSTTIPHMVRIINDGSDEDCRQRILAFIREKPWMSMTDNPGNIGYTASANVAVLGSTADWVILLNSDTIVFPGWIEGLLAAAAVDPQTCFVGPVSNAASYQSVPEVYDGAGKSSNLLSDGQDAAMVAAWITAHSRRHFPQVPLLNGFCMAMRRDVVAELGGFNERAFPFGYGEENDLCVRATKAGYQLRVADHVYVYHRKSASFGHASRIRLSKDGDAAFRALHGEVDIAALGRSFIETPALVELRAAVKSAFGGVPEAIEPNGE